MKTRQRQIAPSHSSSSSSNGTTATDVDVIVPIASRVTPHPTAVIIVIQTTDAADNVPIATAVPMTRDFGVCGNNDADGGWYSTAPARVVALVAPATRPQVADGHCVVRGGSSMKGRGGGVFVDRILKPTWNGCKTVIGNLVYVITPIRS
jgi:hypothetical protein